MKKILFLIIILAVLGIETTAKGALLLRGQGTSVHGTFNLIYDDDLDITWYDYTSPVAFWQDQVNWAASLSVDFGGTIYTDWRLPTTVDDPGGLSYDGSTSAGWNNTTSEMGHLYYTELGNLGLFDTSGSAPQLGYGLNNTGDFQNLVNGIYWSGTEYALNPNTAWYFYSSDGRQFTATKVFDPFGGLAVRDGDVAPSSPEYCSPNGFESPMNSGPVTVRKNRVLPLKVELRDENCDLPITDADIVTPPVLQVTYDSGIGGDPLDVTDDTLSAGWGTDGNQFEYDISTGLWRFNLKTKNYGAPGTYTISIVSGNEAEYTIDSSITATFVIN